MVLRLVSSVGREVFLVCLLANLSACSTPVRMPDPSRPPFSLADVPFVKADPSIDGKATTKPEWEAATRLPDIFFTGPVARAGFYYFESVENWKATSVRTGAEAVYPGHTFVVAHDIVGSPDPKNSLHRFQQNNDGDWNSFEFKVAAGKATIWVFDDADETDDKVWLSGAHGLDRSHLIPEGTGENKIIDRGFIARLNDDPSTDVHWFEGKPEPGDAGWNWTDWHHVFGRHSFGKSFQEKGLDTDPEDAVPHEIYEFVAYNALGDPDPDRWCVWYEWITIEIPEMRHPGVFRDGSPRQPTTTAASEVQVRVLRGDYWLHLTPPSFVLEDDPVFRDLIVKQIDTVLETFDQSPEARSELEAARSAFDAALKIGVEGGDPETLFSELDAGYAHFENAKSAGVPRQALGDLEVQVLSAVATIAAQRGMALDATGLAMDDPTLQALYGGLYDFGQQASQIPGKDPKVTPRQAAQFLRPVFEVLSNTASR